MVKVEGTAYGGAPPSCNGLAAGQTAQGFKAAADPMEAQNTRHFATNANSAIYEDTASLFVDMPETGEPAAGRPLR
jgi:hypothetical protein